MESIKKYNQELINNETEIHIKDYVKEINNKFYKIDISFMDYFMILVGRDEFTIPHKCLYDYGVLTNNETTAKIKRLFDQYEFIEEIDFIVSNVGHETIKGIRYQNEYTMKPDTFKFCLIRAKNSQKYAKYYLLLEKCIDYYNTYQLSMKSNEVNRLIKRLDITNKELKESNYELHETRLELKESNQRLAESNERLEDISDKLDAALDERVLPLDDKTKHEHLIIIKFNDRYKAIRGQKAYIDNQLKKKIHKEGIIILNIACAPNASVLFGHIKNDMNDKINYHYNSFSLIKISEEELLNEIKDIYNKRYEMN